MANNYETMKLQMRDEFLKYDQGAMIEKFGLRSDDENIYITFFGTEYAVNRSTGNVRSERGEANYNEAMTIYDVLCWSKPHCRASGRAAVAPMPRAGATSPGESSGFQPGAAGASALRSSAGASMVNMGSVSTIQGGSMKREGDGLFGRYEAEFDQKDAALSAACAKLGGVPDGKGDVAYRIPMFPFLDVMLQYWDSDDEFPASLQLFVDERMIDFMHYETVWFALSYLLERIRELML